MSPTRSTPSKRASTPPLGAVPWRPHAYQKKAAKWLVSNGAAALFLDPGLGKTSITLAAFSVLKKQGLAKRALVIAPLRVCHSVWPNEVTKWSDFSGLRVVVLHGPEKERALAADADLYVINPEGLPWLLKPKAKTNSWGQTTKEIDVKGFKAHGFDTLIVDELSKFKHTQTQRFKLLKPVLDTFQRRWGLTGSPAANGLMDLFGQVFVLDRGRALGPYMTHFRNTYFTPLDANGWEWALKPGADRLIYDRLRPLALRMSAEDYLDLPPLTTTDIYVELPDNCREIYRKLEDDLIARVGDDVIVVSSASAASIACRQAAAGAIYLTDDLRPELVKAGSSGRAWTELHRAKIDALEDLVDEMQGQPLMVIYEFNHDLERLLAKFPNTPYIGGGVSAKRGKEIEQLWNAGLLPLLFGHPQSMGHGLNLQGVGNYVCWFSPTWNFELYDQTIRRVWRQGQTKNVFVYRILTKGTVDMDVVTALAAKDKTQRSFFEALKQRRGA